jgi:hypothetical protein
VSERSEFAKVLDKQGNLALELKKRERASEDAQKSTPCFNRVPKVVLQHSLAI